MSRSFWAAVGAGGFVLTLGLLAALAAGSSAPAPTATTHTTPAYPVPTVHHIAVLHTPPLAHPKPHATRRPQHATRPTATPPHTATPRTAVTPPHAATPRHAAAPRHLVVLAPGSGYQPAAGSTPVRALQRRLTDLGFAPGPIDGRYGPHTTLAVERFQHARGLTVDGIMGARSFTALDATPPSGLAPGTGTQQPSQQVSELQRRLTHLGFTPGPIDGRYGPRTTLAVERFQSARGLTVTGIIDARTQQALHPATHPARTTRPTDQPTTQPPPTAPQTHSTPVRPATHQPGLPLTPVLVGLAALGLSTILLSYRRTRVRTRRQPTHGQHTPPGPGPELAHAHHTNLQNTDGGHQEEQR